MGCDDLLAVVSMLSKLVPEQSASRVLRQTVADLGALMVGEETNPNASPKPVQPKPVQPKPIPSKVSVTPTPTPETTPPRKVRGVSIPKDVAAWLAVASPAVVARALSKQRITVYDWRRSGRCSPDILPKLEAVFRENQNPTTHIRPTVPEPTDDADDALELEVLARASADGISVEELFDLAGVPDLSSDDDRAKVRAMLEMI